MSLFENYFVTVLRQKTFFNCLLCIMASGLCKQLLGYLVGRDTLMIKRMCCHLWWGMQEIASVVQFQVIIAHQLLLANFAVNIWCANLHSEHIFTFSEECYVAICARVNLKVQSSPQPGKLCVLIIPIF